MPQIECPSGLSGETRKLKVREQNLLADVKKNRKGTAMMEVLDGIWLSTNASGPYKTDRPNWNKVLMGDFFFAMIHMRSVSIAPQYEFRTQCGSCKSSIDWEVNLLELPVQKLSEKSRAIFENGNRFETHCAGKRFQFKLLLADAQQRLLKMKAKSPDKLATAALRMQLLEVEGVKNHELDAFIENMDYDEADELRRVFDEAGCGVETTMDIECGLCDSLTEIELPFGGRDFFTRRKKTKTLGYSAPSQPSSNAGSTSSAVSGSVTAAQDTVSAENPISSSTLSRGTG